MNGTFITKDGVPYQLKSGLDNAEVITDFRQTANCFKAYEVNPAVGCGFRCHYCSMYGQKDTEEHIPVHIYKDYPAYLADFIGSQPDPEKLIFNVSPKTDFFSSELIESGVTAEILRVFRDTKAGFYSLTKGHLPPREIQELLIETRDHNQIIISSGLPDVQMEKLLEPGAATSPERLKFARFCKENGIAVTGIVAPYLPIGDRDEEYRRAVLERFKQVGITHCSIQVLKVSEACLERMSKLMPEHGDRLKTLYLQPNSKEGSTIDWKLPGGSVVTRSYANDAYMRETLMNFKELSRELGMTVSSCKDVCRLIGDEHFNRDALRAGFTCVGYTRSLASQTREP